MVINGSPDLSQLLVNVTWDLSGKFPIIYLQNLSQGQNLANVSYGFYVTSPSQTVIHDGNTSDPDVSGVWTNFTLYSADPDPNLSPPPTNYIVAPWPRPFGQVEWSGAPYMLIVKAKDSNGNTFELPISQEICRPSGNVPTQLNTYGLGELALTTDCNRGNLFFENITNSSYKGLTGTQESSQLKVLYPDDETDTAPTPFILNNFSTALVPITYDSPSYEYVYNGVFLYNFGGGSYVRFRYYRKRKFAVNCNIDLCPLVCEYVKLIEKAITGNCDNVAETNKLLIQINGNMNLALIAKSQPLCGIDLPALIDEIKVLGGFDCDCCSPSGIQPFNSANIGDYNFQVISGGGDISGNVTVTGNNIQFTLYDKNYIFKICDDAPTSAFSVTPSTAGFTKTFCLNVNMVSLATDILNVVKNNQALVNLFNSIIDTGALDFKLIVDGDCIFQTTTSCNYTYGLVNIPANTTYALLTTIKVGNNVPTPVNFAFNLLNLFALKTHLDGLGIGVFTVGDAGAGNVTITSDDNTFGLGDITYKIASISYIADYGKICTGFAPISANEVVQSIIYYLCNLDDSQLVTSQDYTICYATGNAGGSPPTLVNRITIAKGTELNVFLAALLDKTCDTVSYFSGVSSVYRNGINKIGGYVELGGTLIKNTVVNTGGFIFQVVNPGKTSFQINASNISSVVQNGVAISDPVTVGFQRGGLMAMVATLVGDRNSGAYYSAQVGVQTELGQQALIGSYLPTINDASFSPPPNLPNKTTFVKVSQNGAGTTGLVEVYGKEHQFTGDHTIFYSFPVLPAYTTAARDAISLTLKINGMLIFNTTTAKINFWDSVGGVWREVTST